MVKRVLVCGEFHKLNSGYGVMYKELLERLHADPNIEVAEHATYGQVEDAAKFRIPWKFYPNAVGEDDPRHPEYKSREDNQFGYWRFDRVALHFKPDVVFACRDIWMDQHIVHSPLKKYYKTILGIPIDSTPQPLSYIEALSKTDYLMALSKWGSESVQREFDISCPVLGFGADYNIFKPMEKNVVREKWNVPKDAVIFGTVMRNFRRKLFPGLLETFARFLNEKPERRKNYFLYLHTSYPDKRGWNLPELLAEYNIGSNVLISYKCKQCKAVYSSIFSDARTKCKSCGALCSINPNVSDGLTREQLAEVYNLFDLYIQYSTKEGGGFPLVEASACGIPICGPMYSATVSVIENVGGIPIEVSSIERDYDNSVNIAIPCRDSLLSVMNTYQGYPTEQLRSKTIENYSWDKVFDNLMQVINQIPNSTTWDQPFKFHQIPESRPENLSNRNFLKFLYNEVLNKPEEKYSVSALQIQRDVHNGLYMTGEGVQPLDKDKIFQHMQSKARREQWCEQVRLGQRPLHNEDFLLC